jgi:hypothetical protein
MARFDKARRVLVLRVVFAALALLCVVGWLLARSADARAVQDANAAAETRAAAFASSMARSIDLRGGSLAVSVATFSDAAKSAAAADATIVRARLWNADGALVASSDAKDRPGRMPVDQNVRSALRGDAAVADVDATWVLPSGGDPVSGTLTEVAVPLRVGSGPRPVGAMEVDFLRSAIVSSRWQTLSIVLAVGAIVFGIGFVWAMTRKAPAPPVVHKKIEPPPVSAPKIGHDFAARPKQASVWVAAPSDAPPPATSVAELETATARIEELEDQLRRAAEDSERVAALEERVAADAPEIEALRAKLAEAEVRASDAETLLETAQEALASAHAQVGDTRVEEEAVTEPAPTEAAGIEAAVAEPQPMAEQLQQAEVAVPETQEPETEAIEAIAVTEPIPVTEPTAVTEPEPQPEPDDPTDLIAVLEARVAEAEARAQHAKEEAMQLSPEASDLRVRLARTAARKKMGSSAG